MANPPAASTATNSVTVADRPSKGISASGRARAARADPSVEKNRTRLVVHPGQPQRGMRATISPQKRAIVLAASEHTASEAQMGRPQLVVIWNVSSASAPNPTIAEAVKHHSTRPRSSRPAASAWPPRQ